MEDAATDGRGGEHGHGSVQSASAVTEVGSGGNAAAEKTRRAWPGLDGGRSEDCGRLTVAEKNTVDDYGPAEAETTAVGAGVPPSSPVRLAATTRFGCLLLGFLAGSAAAALFLVRHSSPTTCTVTVPT